MRLEIVSRIHWIRTTSAHFVAQTRLQNHQNLRLARLATGKIRQTPAKGKSKPLWWIWNGKGCVTWWLQKRGEMPTIRFQESLRLGYTLLNWVTTYIRFGGCCRGKGPKSPWFHKMHKGSYSHRWSFLSLLDLYPSYLFYGGLDAKFSIENLAGISIHSPTKSIPYLFTAENNPKKHTIRIRTEKYCLSAVKRTWNPLAKAIKSK